MKYIFIFLSMFVLSFTLFADSANEPIHLTLNGENEVNVFQDTPYTELGATATDDRDANVSVSISGNVDTSTLGSYVVTYTATDTAGNSATLQRTVNVVLPPDTEAPVITLNGDVNMTLTQGESYEELGATASDERDGDVNVTIAGSVDTSIEGTYTITYTATDKAGNVVTATRTVNVVAPTLTSISLESNVTTLNVGETAELTLIGSYSDGSSQNVETDIEYIITPRQNVNINGSIVTAVKDGIVVVQAKVKNTFSNIIDLDITWIVTGHTLPLEPDKTLNNSTLLGIDSNDNGVRDDMERYILQTYGKEEITIEIGFQVSRAYDAVIGDPENAWETYKILDAAMDCESYFRNYANMFGDPILIKNRISNSKIFKSLQLNTRERIRGYLLHDKRLSGGVFDLTEISELKSKCSFDTDTLLKARK